MVVYDNGGGTEYTFLTGAVEALQIKLNPKGFYDVRMIFPDHLSLTSTTVGMWEPDMRTFHKRFMACSGMQLPMIIFLACILGLMIGLTAFEAKAQQKVLERYASFEITKHCMIRWFYEDSTDVKTSNVNWVEALKIRPLKEGALRVEVHLTQNATFAHGYAVMSAVDSNRLENRFNACSGMLLK